MRWEKQNSNELKANCINNNNVTNNTKLKSTILTMCNLFSDKMKQSYKINDGDRHVYDNAAFDDPQQNGHYRVSIH